ncbi:pyridoxamine 5'-phosphate oxidase family protein [Aquibacillus kalidii]|uniref:pyridoxamine 5'-phosphate oxidase family protein n=1 Tax=Aquibacillus kalidii TaxID=2762597 RepID=UPI001648F559|nr:pyridoxamine 5'-phosphate oxidase family protein [Aquibacillus kalidii]
MDQEMIKEQAEKILTNHQIGTLSSVKDSKPYSRFMTFFNDNYTLYTATDKDTHKVDEINENPNVHILLGYTYDGTEDTYLEIEGKATVDSSEETKTKLWNDKLSPWFDGPQDKDYTVLKIDPIEIHLMNTNEHEPQIVSFH